MSCTVRAVPRTVPVTFDDPTRGRYGTSTSAMRHPRRGGAQDHLERPAEAAVREAELEQRRRRRAPASARGRGGRRPVRRRTLGRERPGSPTRACTGHAPRSATRAPSTRSAMPPPTGVATRGRSAPSSDPSQSMKQTTSCVGREQAGEAGAPEPSTSARGRRARRGRRRSRRSRRSSRCRRRSAGSRRAATPGRAGSRRLRRAPGSTTSITRSNVPTTSPTRSPFCRLRNAKLDRVARRARLATDGYPRPVAQTLITRAPSRRDRARRRCRATATRDASTVAWVTVGEPRRRRRRRGDRVAVG